MKNPAKTKKPSPATTKTLSLSRVTIKRLSDAALAALAGGAGGAACTRDILTCAATKGGI
jgi:hypothetical protein